MGFCKEFNAKTAGGRHDHPRRDHGLRGPLLHVHPEDAAASACSSRRPPASPTAKKPGAGSKEPNKNKVGKVTEKQVRELAEHEDAGHELHGHRGRDAHRRAAPPARWASTSVELTSSSVAVENAIHDGSRDCSRPQNHRPADAGPRWEADESRRRIEKGRKGGRCRSCPRTARRSTKPSTVRAKYTVEEACALVKKAKFAKFDETVDLAVRLGVNPKHADQMVRGALVLPHGTGQTVRVLVFAKGEKEARGRGGRRRLRRQRRHGGEGVTKASWTSTASSRRPT